MKLTAEVDKSAAKAKSKNEKTRIFLTNVLKTKDNMFFFFFCFPKAIMLL